MTSPRPIKKPIPFQPIQKTQKSRPPQEEQHLLQCFQAFRLPWGGWKLVTSDRAIFTCSVDPRRKKHISKLDVFPRGLGRGKEFFNQNMFLLPLLFVVIIIEVCRSLGSRSFFSNLDLFYVFRFSKMDFRPHQIGQGSTIQQVALGKKTKKRCLEIICDVFGLVK